MYAVRASSFAKNVPAQRVFTPSDTDLLESRARFEGEPEVEGATLGSTEGSIHRASDSEFEGEVEGATLGSAASKGSIHRASDGELEEEVEGATLGSTASKGSTLRASDDELEAADGPA
jgi:hypothetical protein